jgi:hypothetical protein
LNGRGGSNSSNSGFGGNVDINVFVSKSFGFGGTCYIDEGQQAYGLNLIMTSNRQNKFRYYGQLKALQAHFSTPFFDSNGFGGAVGGGVMYSLTRSIALNGEVNYFIGENIHYTDSYGLSSGFKGVAIEMGIVFKLIRKN